MIRFFYVLSLLNGTLISSQQLDKMLLVSTTDSPGSNPLYYKLNVWNEANGNLYIVDPSDWSNQTLGLASYAPGKSSPSVNSNSYIGGTANTSMVFVQQANVSGVFPPLYINVSGALVFCQNLTHHFFYGTLDGGYVGSFCSLFNIISARALLWWS